MAEGEQPLPAPGSTGLHSDVELSTAFEAQAPSGQRVPLHTAWQSQNELLSRVPLWQLSSSALTSGQMCFQDGTKGRGRRRLVEVLLHYMWALRSCCKVPSVTWWGDMCSVSQRLCQSTSIQLNQSPKGFAGFSKQQDSSRSSQHWGQR